VGVLAAGCGSTPEDRGISGAGLGAAGGAIIGALSPVSILNGALIGAVVGGVAGIVTDKNSLDLGEPAWKRGKSQSGAATASSASSSPVVRRIQAALAERGYDPGPVDGRSGPRTRAAIGAYQRDHGMFVDSTPTPELAQHLENS
jgi:peptidoglycan hydrolase-like protein with peptidoglycan-binding domain